jgi:hypothetical protein
MQQNMFFSLFLHFLFHNVRPVYWPLNNLMNNSFILRFTIEVLKYIMVIHKNICVCFFLSVYICCHASRYIMFFDITLSCEFFCVTNHYDKRHRLWMVFCWSLKQNCISTQKLNRLTVTLFGLQSTWRKRNISRNETFSWSCKFLIIKFFRDFMKLSYLIVLLNLPI